MKKFSSLDKKGVLQQEYSQPPILPSPHFRWVVIILFHAYIIQAAFASNILQLPSNFLSDTPNFRLIYLAKLGPSCGV